MGYIRERDLKNGGVRFQAEIRLKGCQWFGIKKEKSGIIWYYLALSGTTEMALTR